MMVDKRVNFNLFQTNNLVPVIILALILYFMFGQSIGQPKVPPITYECISDAECTPIEGCPETCLINTNFEAVGTGCNEDFECECRCDIHLPDENIVVESTKTGKSSVLESTQT